MTRPPQASALDDLAQDLDRLLAVADAELRSGFEGGSWWRQPVHTAYVPAHTFGPDTVRAVGRAGARRRSRSSRQDPAELAAATGLAPVVAAEVHPLVLAKLARQPVEDLRIDFEDGYGTRGDDTEDAHARAAARALATLMREELGAAVHRPAVQEPGAGHQAPGGQDAATLPRHAARARQAAAARLRDHAAQGHVGGSGVRDGGVVRAARRGLRDRAAAAAGFRDPGRDARRRSSAPTAPRRSRSACTRRRTG